MGVKSRLILRLQNAIRAKLDGARPNNKDSPVAEKRKQLQAELTEIRQKQSGHKNSRAGQQERLNSLDAQLKTRIAEQKAARGRVPYKSTDEIDYEIERLEKQVESGSMKIVDEKKALAQQSDLRKLKKAFAGFDDTQKGIDKLRADIAEIKESMNNPENKALSDRYTEVQSELNKIKAEQDEVYGNMTSLRAERDKLYNDQQAKYTAIREIKDAYYKQRRAYKEYEDKAYQARRERQKAERDAYEKERRKKTAGAKLEEASQPAFMDEILTAEGLIRYFDPSSGGPTTTSAPNKFAAQAQRTVDDSNLKGMKVLKKDEEDENYFMGSGGKKGKKGRKGAANGTPDSSAVEAASGKFNMNIGVLDELNKVGVEPPSNQSEVPAVVEKLKAKVAHWKENQDKQTKLVSLLDGSPWLEANTPSQNIEKAQKEIDRLEKEAVESSTAESTSKPNQRRRDAAKKPAVENAGVNGEPNAEAELAQENDAAADVAEELKATKIEDAEEA